MGDYRRSTRECSFDQFQTELRSALATYFVEHDLGELEADALICCETLSEQVKGGFLRRLMGTEEVVQTALMVTPDLLVWATLAGTRPAAVTARRLSEIEVDDYTNSVYARMMDDTGIQVNGFPLGGTERVLAFIGLGEEPAAQQLKDVLWGALEKAREA